LALLETTEIGGFKTPFAKGKVNGCGDAARKAEAAKGRTREEIGFLSFIF